MYNVEILGQAAWYARLSSLTPRVQAKLRTFLTAFSVRVVGQVKANIVNIYRSTGPLYQSVRSKVEETPSSATVYVYTQDIPYAQILEEGGKTRPHVIEPRMATVMAFEGPAGLVFAKRVNHPGSNIPARPYASLALAQMRGEFQSGIREVVDGATGTIWVP